MCKDNIFVFRLHEKGFIIWGKIPHCRNSSISQSINGRIRDTIDTHDALVHDRQLSWLGLGGNGYGV